MNITLLGGTSYVFLASTGLNAFPRAMLEFHSEKESKKVVDDLNGITFMGQRMELSVENSSEGSEFVVSFLNDLDLNSCFLFVGGLPEGFTRKSLLVIFKQFGSIVSISESPNNKK